jgi:molybdate transport system regulatory protein
MPLTKESSLISFITTKSAQNMGLNLGSEIYAIIKSSDISIVNAAPAASEELNIIQGHVKDIEFSEEFIELTFAVNDEKKLVAFLDKTEANSFKIGDEAFAIIRTNNIIIGS